MGILSSPANSLTPFLKLPQEVKNHIYELVLGGNMLHIQRHGKYRTRGGFQPFTHQICYSQNSEEDAQHHFDVEDGSTLCVEGIELRHSLCPSIHKDRTSKMNISLLHTCRQVYNEARFVPYSTNTFSFNTPRILRAFIHSLNRCGVNVNSAFRSLDVELTRHDDILAWTQAFKAVTTHMTLLEKIHINVDRRRVRWFTSGDHERGMTDMMPLCDSFAILEKTQAKSIMIVVKDIFLGGGASNKAWVVYYRRTVDQKRQWVQLVKPTDLEGGGWEEPDWVLCQLRQKSTNSA